MALDYRILSKKDIVKIESNFDETNNVEFIDLLSKTIQSDKFYDVSVVTVEKEYIARPDLVSLAVYGDDKYADILCKVNGISNPFELNEGMTLVCPGFNTINNMLLGSVERNIFINKDNNDSILNINNNNKKNVNEKRSPIEATIFDRNYTFIEGLEGFVFY